MPAQLDGVSHLVKTWFRVLPGALLTSLGTMSLSHQDAAPFVCSLCHFVMTQPVITRCSHLFCSSCFRQWVQTEARKLTSVF